MSNIGAAEILLILVVVAVFMIAFVVIPYWRVFKKAGFHPALGLLMIVPLVNLVMVYYLAFAEWPSLKHDVK